MSASDSAPRASSPPTPGNWYSAVRRAPAQRRQTTETDRLSYQAYAADPRQEGQLIFRIARKTRDNIRRSESRLDISLG